MARRDLVTRCTRQGDRRVVLIELTETGRTTSAPILEAVTDLEHRTLGRLTADEIAGLRAGLQALTEVRS
ncbi:hypothetical protein ACFVX6_27575 [Streptomyces sp. NPDC058289]|uniref:hypothetical protein n=1 Tax=Streptomyces sp. NPDC058289 TaxID=3346425 RepID=UPI0036E8C5E8